MTMMKSAVKEAVTPPAEPSRANVGPVTPRQWLADGAHPYSVKPSDRFAVDTRMSSKLSPNALDAIRAAEARLGRMLNQIEFEEIVADCNKKFRR